MIKVKYKDMVYNFKDNLNFKKFRELIDEYGQNVYIKSPSDWWMEKNDFCVFILNKLSVNNQDINPEEEDWHLFYNVFYTYFLSKEEFDAIARNCNFLLGKQISPTETETFIEFLLLSRLGKLTIDDIEKMPHKKAITLFQYCLGEIILTNIPPGSLIQKQTVGNIYG